MSAVDISLVILAVAVLIGMIRAGIGPSLADRAVAIDVCLFATVAALALLALRFDAAALIDVVLIATLLGFTGTAVLSLLLTRRDRPRGPRR